MKEKISEVTSVNDAQNADAVLLALFEAQQSCDGVTLLQVAVGFATPWRPKYANLVAHKTHNRAVVVEEMGAYNIFQP